MLIKNIKNLIPYFLLIAIYFFFVNHEASKEINKRNTIEKEYELLDKKSEFDDKPVKIRIPVIPYDK
tara:strand:- start:5 stop:205 length:201 start_codon:yes stop_codon:yes gene_type:complete